MLGFLFFIGVAVSPFLLRWNCFSSLFSRCCWVFLLWAVVLFSSHQLGGAAWSPLGGVAFPISSQVVLPSALLGGAVFSPPLLLGGAAWSTPPWGGVASCFVSSSFGRCCFSNLLLGCCLHSPPLGGTAFSHLLKGGAAWFPSSPLICRGAAFLPLLWGWCCFLSPLQLGGASFFWVVVLFSPLRLGGAAWFLPSLDGVDVFLHLLGGAAWSPASIGGVAIHLSFGVVLPSFPSNIPLSSVGWCCLVSCFFGLCCDSNSPLALLWVLAAFTLSSFAWCCFPFPSFGEWCFSHLFC